MSLFTELIRRPLALGGLVIATAIASMAIAAPWIAPSRPGTVL
jgi:hypothetical protein